MSSPPVPDPYVALGVAKDADATQIKTLYRKLALKFHPDKVSDESKKAAAADQFHKIQQAYEILSDADRRSRYDASVRLAELRKEVLQRQQAQPVRPDFVRGNTYDPASTRTSTFTPRAERERYERPRSFDQDDYFDIPSPRTTSRRPSYAEPKKHSKPESQSKYDKEYEKSRRHSSKKSSEKDRKKDRSSKSRTKTYVPEYSDESDLDVRRSRPRYEDPQERDYERQTFRPNKKDSSDSDSEEEADDHTRRIRDFSDSARAYINRSKDKIKAEESRRGSKARNPTFDDVKYSHDMPRRSSARDDGRDYRKEFEKSRQNSAPEVIFRPDVFSRPVNERNHSSPIDKSPTEKTDRQSGKTSSGKTFIYDTSGGSAKLRRGESESAVPTRRPTMPRESSKLKTHVEYQHGLPTPAASPPREYKSSTRYYNMEDDRARDVSPRDTTRRRSPSPHERKSRSHSSRNVPPPPPLAPTSAPRIQIPKGGAYYTDEVVESPRSARPSPNRENSSPLFREIPRESRDDRPTRTYPNYEREPNVDIYGVENVEFKPVKMETGRSSRKSSSAKPAMRRGATYYAGMGSRNAGFG